MFYVTLALVNLLLWLESGEQVDLKGCSELAVVRILLLFGDLSYYPFIMRTFYDALFTTSKRGRTSTEKNIKDTPSCCNVKDLFGN